MGKSSRIWAEQEFGDIDLGDKRLNRRALTLLNRVLSEPESSLNQAFPSWAETKAAYRFFKNGSISCTDLLGPHLIQTLTRALQYGKVLTIQDTAYFSYESHHKTKGLGLIHHAESGPLPHATHGLIIHTVFAVTLDGLPLGILDQKIYSREEKVEQVGIRFRKSRCRARSVFEPESIRWIEALINTYYLFRESHCKPITVCDREGDIYNLFEHAHILKTPLLVRAKSDRMVRGASRFKGGIYAKKPQKIGEFLTTKRKQGTLAVEIPSRGGPFGSAPRNAYVEIRFARISITRQKKSNPRAHVNKLVLIAISVVEKHPPKQESPINWILLTNQPVNTFEDAAQYVRWYSYRFRIETLHRILKSGFHVEQCRLGDVESLSRYLTLMSIASWRIFWITSVGRSIPNSPCTVFLSDTEWKALYLRFYPSKKIPRHPITTQRAVHLIGRLGGFMDRRCDGEPGVISLWRGWRRLNDLAEGWILGVAA